MAFSALWMASSSAGETVSRKRRISSSMGAVSASPLSFHTPMANAPVPHASAGKASTGRDMDFHWLAGISPISMPFTKAAASPSPISCMELLSDITAGMIYSFSPSREEPFHRTSNSTWIYGFRVSRISGTTNHPCVRHNSALRISVLMVASPLYVLSLTVTRKYGVDSSSLTALVPVLSFQPFQVKSPCAAESPSRRFRFRGLASKITSRSSSWPSVSVPEAPTDVKGTTPPNPVAITAAASKPLTHFFSLRISHFLSSAKFSAFVGSPILLFSAAEASAGSRPCIEAQGEEAGI